MDVKEKTKRLKSGDLGGHTFEPKRPIQSFNNSDLEIIDVLVS